MAAPHLVAPSWPDFRSPMKLRYAATALAMAAPAILFAFTARTSFAFDASYHREPKDLPPQLAAKLTEQVSDEAEPYLDKEDEKHSSGETYVDLQQKFEYLPSTGSDGRMVVSAKLGGAEFESARQEWLERLNKTGMFERVVSVFAEGIDPDEPETRTERFEFGLDCVLAGIAAEVPAVRHGSG